MKIYSVSEFVQTIRDYLKEGIGEVVIQGEVSDFRKSKGNLVYFELKDEESRVLCFMLDWELKIPLEDGIEIRILGYPSLFKGSGGFHIRVLEIELVGEGALRKALEMLKVKLEKEGLFAPERKRILPAFPSCLGLITSPDAAAYTDVLRILKNRWSALTIKFFPVAVQGMGSVSQIVRAFDYFNQIQDAEVIILTRGGGSLEDLQSFNSEEVARAIFASKIPVVCGVGHERDYTIADLVTDRRASTPSNAAEIVVPDKNEVLNTISWKIQLIDNGIRTIIENQILEVDNKVEILEQGIYSWKEKFVYNQDRLKQGLINFRQKIEGHHEKLISFLSLFQERFSFGLEKIKQKVSNEEKLIKTLSPQATLDRGYSLTYDGNNQKIIKNSQEVKKGDLIKTHLAKGKISSVVKETKN